jgi:hypothetical protein
LLPNDGAGTSTGSEVITLRSAKATNCEQATKIIKMFLIILLLAIKKNKI